MTIFKLLHKPHKKADLILGLSFKLNITTTVIASLRETVPLNFALSSRKLIERYIKNWTSGGLKTLNLISSWEKSLRMKVTGSSILKNSYSQKIRY